jgi:hypothetical protein
MNRIIAIFFLFSVIACNAGNDIPKGILPPQKMQYVMWDMIQVDGLASYSFDTMLRRPAKRMELYYTVLSTHKLSQDAFRNNIHFYESRPDLFKIVLDSLQQMALRDTATIVTKSQKVTQDSVAVRLDTIKFKRDTIKARKLSIEKMKALKMVKPV